MVNARSFLVALGALWLAPGCKPDLAGRPSIIDGNRLLAVQSLPAESKPGTSEAITYRALYVGPDGEADASGFEWAFCSAQKPLAVNAPMAPVCLARAGESLDQFHARGREVTAILPKEGCTIFGPLTPPPKPPNPPGRAADPDTTGGYYQPIRVLIPEDPSPEFGVAVTRLNCDLGNATADQSREYSRKHHPNENPSLESVELVRSDGAKEPLVAGSASHARTKPGETVTFRVTWPGCPVTPVCGDGVCSEGEHGTSDCLSTEPKEACCPDDCGTGDGATPPHLCGGSESYTMLDPVAHALVQRRESMRVSWYATAGDFDHERTGTTETDAALFRHTENAWTAPATTGTSYLWVVLRDDRGGVGFETYEIDVEP